MLQIESLKKTFITHDGTRVPAIGGISLDIQPGKLLTLLGPSGCGKTTTLRSVAGLETPEAGVIKIGNTVVYDSSRRTNIPANQRGIGMVFQSYAIWPHMTVFENVAFPLRVAQDKRFSSKVIAEKVARALEMVRLGGYQNRSSTQLSGGQQQRLALARGLVREPELLLLDEPLSNLDATLREEMRFELKRLQLDLGITTLYVTHDQAEALALSDEIAVMRGGHVIQRGTPFEIYHKPNSEFVAGFVGSTNLLRGKVQQAPAAGSSGTVEVAQGRLSCTFNQTAAEGENILVAVRPEDIAMATAAPSSSDNTFSARISNRIFLGDVIDYQVEAGGEELRVRARPEWDFKIGDQVFLTVPSQKCIGLAGAALG